MIRRLNENTYYETECVFDKQGRDMVLYTSSVNEVDCNRKPKDSLKREGSFMVQRKYFNTRDEAQDFIDSIPKVSSPSRDESIIKRKSRKMNESIPSSDPSIEKTINDIEEYFEKIMETVSETNEDGLYYMDYIKSNLYRIDKVESFTRMELWKELYEALKYYKDAERNIRRALENIGSASNELRNLLK